MNRISRLLSRQLTCFGSILFVALLLGFTPPARAQLVLDETSKTVDGLLVYIGLLPAEMLKVHVPAHTEKQMHGGVPSGKHEYHFVVAIFDSETGDRVTDAHVTARLSPLGLVGLRKDLEPMDIAGTRTYGQFFDLPTSDRYVINLEIKRPKAGKPVAVEFVEFTFHHEPGSHP